MNEDIVKKAINKRLISREEAIQHFEGNKDIFDRTSTQEIGVALGKFRLIKLLGRGLCEVHLAYDNILKREVALKILTGTTPQDFQRFYREAVLCAKLDHPNIVHIYEIGEAGGKHYISMQYIDGQSLAEIRLSLEESLNVIAAISHAVEYAHSLGIMHRDIKPGNILIDKSGKPYLSDFGIAKRIELTREKEKISLTGMIIGTPSFMSPEQAHGDKIDYLSDIYSLGATLYYLVIGKEPFAGSTVMQVINKVINEDPALPRSLNKNLSAEVEAIIMKAMSKEKDRRYLAAIELARDIERYLRGDPISARPTSVLTRTFRKIKRNKLLVPMTVLLIAFISIFGYVIFQWIKKMDTVSEYKMLAEQYYTKGDLEKAREFYQRVLDLGDDDQVRQRVNEIDGKISRKNKARQELDRWLVMLENANRKFYSKQTTPEEVQELMKQLISKLDEIIETYPLANAYYYRGKLYREAGRYELGLKDLTRAIELDPDLALAHLEMIRIRFDMLLGVQVISYTGSTTQVEQTVEDIRQGISKLYGFQFEQEQAQRLVAQAKVIKEIAVKKDYTKALELLEDLSKDYVDEEVYNIFAMLYCLLQDYEKGLDYIKKSLEINPTKGKSYFRKGMLNERLKKDDEALADYSKTIAFSPHYHSAYISRSSIYYRRGDLVAAEEDVSNAIELCGSDGMYYGWRGQLRYYQRKFDAAIRDFDQAVKLMPDEPRFYLQRGWVRIEIADYDAALKDFQTLISMQPDNYLGYTTVGGIYFELKDYQEAIKQLSRAIQLKSDDVASIKFRGFSYYYVGDYQNALVDLERVCQLSLEVKADELVIKLIRDCRRRLGKH